MTRQKKKTSVYARLPRRHSSARSRPMSSIPTRDHAAHSVYVELANLQMARSRYVTIRDSLSAQLAHCEDEIAHTDARIATLMAQLQPVDPTDPITPRTHPAPRERSARPGMTVDDLRASTFTIKY